MRFRTMALTLAFSLGVCGALCADESGNWFTRIFTRTSAKSDPKVGPTKNGQAALNPVPSNDPLIKAYANLRRRQDVCQRLREIAVQIGDDDLARQAELLDLRAYDLFMTTSNRLKSQQPIGMVDLKELKAAEKRAKGGR